MNRPLVERGTREREKRKSTIRLAGSLRTADAFPVVASLRSGSQTLFFGAREATTGNASAVRRLAGGPFHFVLRRSKTRLISR